MLVSLHTYAQNERVNITGGVEVDIDERPFQASIQQGGNHFCGCSIVNDRYVVTAAHCVQGRTAENLRVAVGVTEQTQVGTNGQLVDVRRIVTHPNYNSNTSDNDIAIIELANPINFNANAQPIRIINNANRNLINLGQQTIVSGWGWTTPGQSSAPNHLRAVTVPIISNNEASRQLGRALTNNMIATSYVGNRQGPCHGDSGGPLTREDGRGIPYLIGAVSWGRPGCPEGQNSPSVYTSVINYQNWIYDNICQENMTIRGGIFSDVLLEASNEVRYSGTVQGSANALIRAGRQIILSNGFTTRPTGNGEVFVSIGGNCTNTGAARISVTDKRDFSLLNIDKRQLENFEPATTFPNPFTNELTVSYFLEEESKVNLLIYDIAGYQVVSSIKQEKQKAGNYVIKLNTSELPTGIYMYQLKVNNQEFKGKIIKQ